MSEGVGLLDDFPDDAVIRGCKIEVVRVDGDPTGTPEAALYDAYARLVARRAAHVRHRRDHPVAHSGAAALAHPVEIMIVHHDRRDSRLVPGELNR